MKIKALLLSAILILNIFVLPAAADEAVIADYESAAEFLAMLGITDGINTDDTNRAVTRAEFAALSVNMTNLSGVTTDADEFTDVDITEGYGSKIYDALYLGIVSESPDSMFYPDNEILYEPAVKMVVEALGYGKKARIFGGYPSGYLKVANELGILRGVGKSMKLGDALILVSNALVADVWIFDGVTDDTVDYKTEKGKNLLTENFGLSHTKGIVTTAGLYSADFGCDSIEPRLEIAGTMYKTDIENAEKYLGYSVDAWYNDKGEVKTLLAESSNFALTLYGRDVVKYSGLELTVEKENKDKIYKLDSGYTYILNGRLHNQTDRDFMFENGTLTLVDNNGDNKYDFVIADRYEFFKAASIDELSRILYDNTDGSRSLQLLNDGNCNYQYESFNVSKNIRTPATFDSIAVGNLLEVKKSDDGQLAHITILTGNGVSGKIEEIGTDYIVINGNSYKLSDSFLSRGEKIFPSMTASFLISSDKRIVLKTDIDSASLYGYYLDFKSDSGLEKAQIKILGTDNEILVYPVSDKVKVNNTALTDANDLKPLLIRQDTGTPIYQIIKYSVNSNGEIKNIDTLSDAPSDGSIITNAAEGDDLIRYADKEGFMYKSTSSLIVPHGRIGSNTVVFSVPFDLTKEGTRDFVYERYSDENFACVGTSRLKNDNKSGYIGQTDYKIDIYDYSTSYIPGAVVVYDMTGGAVKKVNPTVASVSYMVDGVTNAIDSDGNETIKITLCSLTSYQSYIVNYEIFAEITADGDIPSKGDIIRCSLNEQNEIVGIARDVVPSDDKKSFTINYETGSGEDFLSSNISYKFTYGAGRVKTFAEGLLTLDFMGKTPTPGTGVDLSKGYLPFSISAAKAVLYSGDRNPVRVINASDIKTDVACGEGCGDIIVGRITYYNMTTLFVYRAQ